MAQGIAFKIDAKLLQDIHVRAAEKGLSTQQYVTELIERDLFPERFPQLTENQIERLKTAMETVDRALEDVTDILWDGPEQAAGSTSMAPESEYPQYPQL